MTRTEGYKEAFKHFEEVINAMYRDKEVNFDYLKGIESVFQYFEAGAEIKEKAQSELDLYKDEV